MRQEVVSGPQTRSVHGACDEADELGPSSTLFSMCRVFENLSAALVEALFPCVTEGDVSVGTYWVARRTAPRGREKSQSMIADRRLSNAPVVMIYISCTLS